MRLGNVIICEVEAATNQAAVILYFLVENAFKCCNFVQERYHLQDSFNFD